MSMQTEIARIQTARNTIRSKLVELGLSDNTDNLTSLATAVENMPNNGSVDAAIDGVNQTSYTIAPGFYGSGSKVSLTNDIETALANI